MPVVIRSRLSLTLKYLLLRQWMIFHWSGMINTCELLLWLTSLPLLILATTTIFAFSSPVVWSTCTALMSISLYPSDGRQTMHAYGGYSCPPDLFLFQLCHHALLLALSTFSALLSDPQHCRRLCLSPHLAHVTHLYKSGGTTNSSVLNSSIPYLSD